MDVLLRWNLLVNRKNFFKSVALKFNFLVINFKTEASSHRIKALQKPKQNLDASYNKNTLFIIKFCTCCSQNNVK